MRLHVVDLSVDDFLAGRDKFVELVKGDYFQGTRDVTIERVVETQVAAGMVEVVAKMQPILTFKA